MIGQTSRVTASVSGQYVNPAALQPEGDGQTDDTRAQVSETQVMCLPVGGLSSDAPAACYIDEFFFCFFWIARKLNNSGIFTNSNMNGKNWPVCNQV